MDEDHGEGCLLLLLVAVILMGVLYLTFRTGEQEGEMLKIEAIQRGYATWKVDELGNTTFTWKETTP